MTVHCQLDGLADSQLIKLWHPPPSPYRTLVPTKPKIGRLVDILGYRPAYWNGCSCPAYEFILTLMKMDSSEPAPYPYLRRYSQRENKRTGKTLAEHRSSWIIYFPRAWELLVPLIMVTGSLNPHQSCVVHWVGTKTSSERSSSGNPVALHMCRDFFEKDSMKISLHLTTVKTLKFPVLQIFQCSRFTQIVSTENDVLLQHGTAYCIQASAGADSETEISQTELFCYAVPYLHGGLPHYPEINCGRVKGRNRNQSTSRKISERKPGEKTNWKIWSHTFGQARSN